MSQDPNAPQEQPAPSEPPAPDPNAPQPSTPMGPGGTTGTEADQE